MGNENLQGKKILVAEDDPASQELMKDIITGMGVSVEIAQDGAEAVEKFKQSSFDLVFLDINMPKKSGTEAIQEIRSIDSKKTPIFALTASVIEDEKKKIMGHGFDGFIAKPIQVKALREKITQILTGAKS